MGLNLLVVKCAKNIEARSENRLIDLGERELNHLRAAFFNVIGKAQHLIGSETPASAILDLKASICSWGSVLPLYGSMSDGGLIPFGGCVRIMKSENSVSSPSLGSSYHSELRLACLSSYRN